MKNFTVAKFDSQGELLESGLCQVEPNPTTVFFEQKLARLSGDFELPMEGKLPGEFDFIDFRIGSDLSGAYVLYYLHDEVVFASLFLRGKDEVSETELTQVFKFLLLDTNDSEEPTEEEIEEILNATSFNFDAIEDRPIAFTLRFSDEPDEVDACNHIEKMNICMAAAYLFPTTQRDAISDS